MDDNVFIYAGIDESGYGPLFGPLVIGRSVFAIRQKEAERSPPDLWSLLKTAVCKKVADKKHRIPVNDSKAVYNTSLGVIHLERGVLAFLHTLNIEPQNLSHLLDQLAYDEESRRLVGEWYFDESGGPHLPVESEEKRLARDRDRLRRCSEKSGVRLLELSAAVVSAERFNRIVKATRSKAACSWKFVGGHLLAIWERYGNLHPCVAVDRQGGRRNYLQLLYLLFPRAGVEVLEKNAVISRYRIRNERRAMEVEVRVASERFHFPVALASMTAKYVRELLLIRFQQFWKLHAPEVKPTFGYSTDARRFLNEIEPLIDRLRIDRESLIRCR